MVRAEYQGSPYATKLTCREHQLIADVTAEKGGLDAGLRPHDFLEASLASCLQITLRMYAQKHGIEVGETSV
ncbi:MAG TPA: disulfide bond formation regulator, partial [Gammaproteobacteria bacterium]|nr:disulfide bond formation regulator [Gammaproteobacteria bacterium]